MKTDTAMTFVATAPSSAPPEAHAALVAQLQHVLLRLCSQRACTITPDGRCATIANMIATWPAFHSQICCCPPPAGVIPRTDG